MLIENTLETKGLYIKHDGELLPTDVLAPEVDYENQDFAKLDYMIVDLSAVTSWVNLKEAVREKASQNQQTAEKNNEVVQVFVTDNTSLKRNLDSYAARVMDGANNGNVVVVDTLEEARFIVSRL